MLKIQRNAYKGRRAFVIGAGPSIAGMDLSPLKGEIVICVNESYKAIDWEPDFICIADHRLWPLVKSKYATMRSQIVCSADVDGSVGSDYTGKNLVAQIPVDTARYVHKHGFSWSLPSPPGLPKALNVMPMLVLPFVCWAGFDSVYLLGCDCTNDGYFYTDSARPGCQVFKSSAMRAYETIAATPDKPTRIYNATVGGNLNCFPRITLEDAIRGGVPRHDIVVTGYYTPDLDYEQQARDMAASVARYGLQTCIHRLESYPVQNVPTGSCLPWVLNCSLCSDCIQKTMDMYPDKYILYLDADARMIQSPGLFLDFPVDYDFAAPILTNHIVQNELTSNTLFFAPTDASRRLVRDWNIEQKKRNQNAIDGMYAQQHREAWDQKVLQDVLNASPDVRFKELPWTYAKITRTPKGHEIMEGVDPNHIVIEQHQASRKNKWKVGRDV